MSANTSPAERSAASAAIEARTSRLAAGAVAGVFSRTVTAPLERIKLQRQVLGNQTPFAARFRQLAAAEGWRQALFRGNGTNCAKVLPASAIRFTAFEEYKALLVQHGIVRDWHDNDPALVRYRMACGAAAGATAVSAVYPLDVLRTRLSVQDARAVDAYGGPLDAAQKIWRSEGVRGFYRGIGTAALSVVPFTALNFGTYDTLKQAAAAHHCADGTPLPLWASAALGGVAGAAAMTVMFPVDVVRHRMMASREDTRGGWVTARNIYAQGGWRLFYRGLLPSYAKVVPTVALTWFAFEACKRALRAVPE